MTNEDDDERLTRTVTLRLTEETVRDAERFAAEANKARARWVEANLPPFNKALTVSDILRRAIKTGLDIGFRRNEDKLRDWTSDLFVNDLREILAHAVVSDEGARLLKRLADHKPAEFDFG
jgi:hypothetical protein